MDIERPETPLSLRIAGWVGAGLVALVLLRWVLGLVRFLFTIAVLVALVAAVVFVVRQFRKN